MSIEFCNNCKNNKLYKCFECQNNIDNCLKNHEIFIFDFCENCLLNIIKTLIFNVSKQFLNDLKINLEIKYEEILDDNLFDFINLYSLYKTRDSNIKFEISEINFINNFKCFDFIKEIHGQYYINFKYWTIIIEELNYKCIGNLKNF